MLHMGFFYEVFAKGCNCHYSFHNISSISRHTFLNLFDFPGLNTKRNKRGSLVSWMALYIACYRESPQISIFEIIWNRVAYAMPRAILASLFYYSLIYSILFINIYFTVQRCTPLTLHPRLCCKCEKWR